MTQQEFESRVGIEVTFEIFRTINEAYMECDMNKDDFCNWWKRNNRRLIAECKAQKAAKVAKDNAKHVIKSLYERLANYSWNQWLPSFMTDAEYDACKVFDINPNQTKDGLQISIYHAIFA